MALALVYDVGMNNGDDTAFYLHEGHSMIAIEAIPELVEAGGMRFRKGLEAQRLFIINVGDRGRIYNR